MQCLLTKRLPNGEEQGSTRKNDKNHNYMTLTPETPPFTGMKRVFGSSEFKGATAQNYNN